MVSLLTLSFTKELYIILLAVIPLLIEKILIIQDKIKTNGEIFSNNPNYTNLLMYLAEIFSIFIYFLTKIFKKEEEKKNEKMINSIKNYDGLTNFKDGGVTGKQLIYVLLLLFICSLFDLFYNTNFSNVVHEFFKYEHLKLTSLFTFCTFMSRKIFFKNKFYAHHYFSLLLIIIIIPIECFSFFISKEKMTPLEYIEIIGFGFLREMFQCLQLCIEKYLNNYYFISFYGLMFFEGIIGFILVSSIEGFKYYFKLTNTFLIDFSIFKKDIYYIIFSFITCLDLLIFNLIKTNIVCEFSPVHYGIIFCFYELIIAAYIIITEKKYFAPQIIFTILSFLFLLIVNCIFSEIIEVNCCNLSFKTERKIESRNARQIDSDFEQNSDCDNEIKKRLMDDELFLSTN